MNEVFIMQWWSDVYTWVFHNVKIDKKNSICKKISLNRQVKNGLANFRWYALSVQTQSTFGGGMKFGFIILLYVYSLDVSNDHKNNKLYYEHYFMFWMYDLFHKFLKNHWTIFWYSVQMHLKDTKN